MSTNSITIEIIKCALDSNNVSNFDINLLNNLNYQDLINYASYQQVLSILSLGLENINNKYHNIDQNILSNLIKYRYQVITKLTQLDNERSLILSDFETNHIWYMPLKGIIMKDIYPLIGIREMVDNDILFDSSKQLEVKQIFESHGYKSVLFNDNHHDTYEKAPSYNFEMHTTLMDEGLNINKLNDYYSNTQSLMIKDTNNNYGYHMSLDDFYISLLTHIYKHYNFSGIGIKSLIDIYVYINKYIDTLNFNYINSELTKLDILDFSNRIKSLSLKLFSNETYTLTNQESKLLEYMVMSGSHGNEQINLKLKIDKLDKGVTSLDDIDINTRSTSKAKIKYSLKRLFPSKELLMDRYPFCKNHPNIYWLIHFYRIYSLITNKDRVNSEFKDIKND